MMDTENQPHLIPLITDILVSYTREKVLERAAADVGKRQPPQKFSRLLPPPLALVFPL